MKATQVLVVFLLFFEIVLTPLVVIGRTIPGELHIQDTYLSKHQVDNEKLSLTIEEQQTTVDRVVVRLTAREGELSSSGILFIFQKGFALEQDSQGRDILPSGFTRESSDGEDNRGSPSSLEAGTSETDTVSPYGEGYDFLRLSVDDSRSIEWKIVNGIRYEEHVFTFKKVAAVQSGDLLAVATDTGLSILTSDNTIFDDQKSNHSNDSKGSIVVQLRVQEENSSMPQIPLVDSEFEVSSVNQPNHVFTVKTDINGNATFNNLPLGQYIVKQVSTNDGYTVSQQVEQVELAQAQLSKTVLFTNSPSATARRYTSRQARSIEERATVPSVTLGSGVETYGITYANIDTFGYYQFQDGYNTYGAGMDVKWKLPAEAKEGDYFTLNFGNQILLNRAPMYSDSETVPYDRLDSVENRYTDEGIENLFFQIVTRGNNTEPSGIPILNVYYTKAGELTFVVQKYANDKGVIEGEAIIGKQINKEALTAMTDGNGRHRSTKKIRSNGTDTKLSWDIYDLEDQIARYDFYEGFYPNFMLMTEQAGAVPVNNNPWFLGRDITYTSTYMNSNPVFLDDANGDPGLSGIYVNQRTQLFENTFDYGYNNGRTTSFGRDALFPVYEDREYLYYYFVYNANKGASGQGAWQVYFKPAGAELEIVDTKLFQGYTGAYKDKTPTSMVPWMETVDPYNPEAGTQVSTGKRINRYNATEWMVDFGGSEKNGTYFGIIKAKKKTPTAEAADLNRLGFHIEMVSRQTIFANRNLWDYYVPTEGFGQGWTGVETPKDALGDFKIKKTDPNKEIVYPSYEVVNGKVQYEDLHGNTYTYNAQTGLYVDTYGRALTQKTDSQGNLLFEDNLHRIFTQKRSGNSITYVDAQGGVYRQKAGEEDLYVSADGTKFFRPSRPLLKDYDVQISISSNRIVTDVQEGKVLTTLRDELGVIEVVDRFSNLLRLSPTSSGGLNAWKYDPVAKQFVAATVTKQGNNFLISALPISTTYIVPKLKESFSFKLTDTQTGLSFDHNVDEYGYAIFPSMLVGHTYRLEETSAKAGYIRTPKVYLLMVTAVGQVRITDENGQPISTSSDPLSVVDANNLLYSVINDVVRLNIKKTDMDGNIVTADKATFKVYKSGDYTISSGRVQPNANAVPVATIQTSKTNNGTTIFGESVGTVIPNVVVEKNYAIVEETAPDGYEALTKGIEIKLVRSGARYVWQLVSGTEYARIESDQLTLSVKNEQKKKTLRIAKRIKGLETISGLFSGNMTFTLTKDDDATVQIVKTQSANTDFVFENLTDGIYTLTETTPPSGYATEPVVYKVSVSKAGVHLYKVSSQEEVSRVTNATLVKSADLSNIQSGQEAFAIDGQDGTSVTYFNFNGQGDHLPQGAYIGLDLQRVQRVKRIHYLQGNQSNLTDRMNRFTIEYSLDGQTYYALSSYSNVEGADLTTDVFARYIRVKNDERVTQKWYAIRELSVFAQSAEAVDALETGQYPIGNIQHPQIFIEKRDMNNTRIQRAATFKLYKVSDDATDQNVAAMLTDANLVQTFELAAGQSSQKLQATTLGRYALVETAAPTGYIGLSSPVLMDLVTAQQVHSGTQMKTVSRFTLVNPSDMVTIDASTANSDNTLRVYVKNEFENFHLKVLKRHVTNGSGLVARFELYNEDGTQKINQGNTSQDGNSLTFRGLQAGTYVLKEVSSPAGFNTIAPIKLTINRQGQVSILSGPQNLVEAQNASGNNEVVLTVKNRPYTNFSIEKVSDAHPDVSLAGVQLEIKAKGDGPAPLFNTAEWHIQHYGGVVDTQNKALRWWTQSSDVGNAVFQLPQGTYTITELAAPQGYELLEPFDIVVGEDGQVTFASGNHPQATIGEKDGRIHLKLTNRFKPRIKVIKVDSQQTSQKLSGARFKLFSSDEITQIGDEVETSDSGEILLPAIYPGTYYLQETQPPTGYQTNTKKYKLIISANGTTTVENGDNLISIANITAENLIPITIKNTVKTYRVTIKKRDYNQPTQGLNARFELFEEDGTTPVVVNGVSMKGDTVQSGNTLTFPNLPAGTYVLKETRVPSGSYRPVSQLIDTKFRINPDGSVVLLQADTEMVAVGQENDTIVFTIKNIQLFTFQVQKVDSRDDSIVLNGAQFTIYYDTNNDGVKEDVVATGQTVNGVFQTQLSPGYYIVKETQAPSGYVLNEKEYRFQINHDGTTALHNADDSVSLANTATNQRVVSFKMKNTKRTINLKLAKRSYSDVTQRLAAQFELKDAEDTSSSITKTTTTSGDEIVFEGLEVGKTYLLTELQAPDGYQRITTVYRLIVDENGVIRIDNGDDLIAMDSQDSMQIIVKNLRRGEYPKTGGIGILSYIVLGGLIVLIAAVAMLRRRQQEEV